MTGAITTNSTFDGVDIATRDAILTSTTTTANAALPKSGGAMTGAITTNSTFDGVDIATRDGVLTSTTTTANAALPKAGGTMTGNLAHADNIKSKFGASDDLEIYHENTNHHSYVWEKGSGDLYLRGTDVRIKSNTDNDDMATFIENGAASLFYSNALKLATTNTGVDVTGTLTTTGNVGIGASPTAPSSDYKTLEIKNTATSGRALLALTAKSTEYSHIFFGDEDDQNIGELFYYHPTNAMYFKTNTATAMVIDSSQRVGIGTTSQADPLTVKGTFRQRKNADDNLESFAMWPSASTAGQTDFFSWGHNNSTHGGYGFWTTQGNGTGDNLKMIILNNGKVGIGTASPSKKLHVAGTSYFSDQVFVGATTAGTTSPSMVINHASNANAGLHIQNSSTSTSAYILRAMNSSGGGLNVNGGGNVGIGTTGPYKALTISRDFGGEEYDILDLQSSVSGGGTQPMIRFGTWASNSNTIGRIGFVDIPNYGGGFVVETNSSGSATDSTTEKFRIDKDGKVGIGTASPAATLDVDGNAIGFPSASSNPSSPAAGWTYYNTTDDTLKTYNGTTWDDLVTSAFSATGGTITNYGSYRVHTFTSSGTFTPNKTGQVDVLVVAGGGGGGGGSQNGGGAGGAGGMVASTGINVAASAYSITVGAGGAAGSGRGGQGGNSSAIQSSLTAIGGGYGAERVTSVDGGDGGSGGSACRDSLNSADPGSGTSGQGYAGGEAGADTCAGGGGGGGAGGTGYQGDAYDCNSTRSPSTASQGGVGAVNNFRTGSNIYYAGGGGGSGHYSDGPAPGGNGGGGSGGVSSGTDYAAGNGATNKGGGGGAGHDYGSGAGGSGIVVIRYAV
jgi:hypothetical protein